MMRDGFCRSNTSALRRLMITDFCLVSYDSHSATLLKFHVIGCIHIHIHIHVHRVHVHVVDCVHVHVNHYICISL